VLLPIVAIIAVIFILVIAVYNSLVSLKVKIKEAWSQIDVQLKRRADLIPNIVETVKGYAAHEKKSSKMLQPQDPHLCPLKDQKKPEKPIKCSVAR